MAKSLINATRGYDSVTNKGAITHSTSLNFCLDMFFLAGASRQMEEKDIIRVFEKAYGENPGLALKILFWSRDARGGAGERRFFQTVMKHIGATYPDILDELMIHLPEYGYWKDVFVIEKPSENSLNWLSVQLNELENPGLLAKWFPRKGPWFSAMHKYLKVTPKEFRKRLVAMTKVVETQMCQKDWTGINYSHVPSIAMNKYRKAFFKHDEVRMKAFIEAVHKGEAKINAGVLHPHQLYQAMNQGQDAKAVEAQWMNLINYMEGSTERIIPMCDVSGSMSGLPMDVSVSLGIYISERNEGIFKDAFLTFHENPEMQYLKGSLAQRMRQLSHADWGGTTNLQATFDLVLNSAIREKLPEDQMPTKLLIISDMEFDEADGGYRSKTNLDVIREKYKAAGYVMPQIIFWNVNGRPGNSPAQKTDSGVGLVSGFSPSILKTILKGKVYGPTELMLDTVMTERYARIEVDKHRG
jgi:hypothetical protein